MSSLLQKWTGQKWLISLSNEEGEDSLYQQDRAEQSAISEMVGENELIKAVLATFEGASIADIHRIKDEFLISNLNADSDYLISANEFGLDDDE